MFVLMGEEGRINKLVQVVLPSEGGDYLNIMEQNSLLGSFAC